MFIKGLVNPADLERLVLAPLRQVTTDMSPDTLAESAIFPAPELKVAHDVQTLREALVQGMVAVHMDGRQGALLVGDGRQAPGDAFVPNLGMNLVLLRRVLQAADLRVELLPAGPERQNAIAYVKGVARSQTVRAVRQGSQRLSPQRPGTKWWRWFWEALRLPPWVETTAPPAVAEFLRRGYVATLADQVSGVRLAPLTIELLLSGTQDESLSPALRRLVRWVRLCAIWFVLFAPGLFIAVTSYHHDLLPGPFLVGLAAARANLPLSISVELLLVQLFTEMMWAGVGRLGGLPWTFFAVFGTALGAMVALQGGLLAPVNAALGIATAACQLLLPNRTLSRVVRVWKYAFMGAAAALGVYGMTLLAFLVLAYLGEERAFGHPIRRPPGEVIR